MTDTDIEQRRQPWGLPPTTPTRARPVVTLARDFTFQASHQLPHVPEGHKCGRLHGHSYRLTVTVAGPVNPDTGWVLDFGDLKDYVQPLIDERLEHRHLNDICQNPTVENLLIWLWGVLTAGDGGGVIEELALSETGASRAVYRGQQSHGPIGPW